MTEQVIDRFILLSVITTGYRSIQPNSGTERARAVASEPRFIAHHLFFSRAKALLVASFRLRRVLRSIIWNVWHIEGSFIFGNCRVM
jgi:hypothetical protein